MIVTQVYNPFACYQMSRPQSILMRIYIDILKCTHNLLHMYFRQFLLKSMIVFFFIQNSRKPGICISFSSKRSSALYRLHMQWLAVCKRFLLQHIFVYVIIHTYVVFEPRGVYLILGNKGKYQTCSFNFASFLCDETQPFFVIRCCCQWHEDDLSDSLIKDTIITTRLMILPSLW